MERFRFYMIQDYRYLLQYAKVFALGIVKAEEEELQRLFAGMVHDTLDGEMKVHKAYMARLGITEEEVARTLRPEGEVEGGEEGGILKDPTILALPSLASLALLLFFCQAGEPGMREERKAEEASLAAAHITPAPTSRITRTQIASAAKAIYLRPSLFAHHKHHCPRRKEQDRRRGYYEHPAAAREGQRGGDDHVVDHALGCREKVQGVCYVREGLGGGVGEGGSKSQRGGGGARSGVHLGHGVGAVLKAPEGEEGGSVPL